MDMLELHENFQRFYNRGAFLEVTAPGRVNLIGEHTDYNEGFVLPCALQYKTTILASPRTDRLVEAKSLQYPGQIEKINLDEEIKQGPYAWGNYLRGVLCELLKRNQDINGFDMLIDSSVPQGSGLSSSAALEVAIAGAVNNLSSLGFDKAELARIGQLAENNFINCQCGIMDQLISAEAQAQAALLIDCRDLSSEQITIPENLSLLVINSNYPRKLADSEYNERRMACENAAAVLGINSLREANLVMLDEAKSKLNDTVYKRAKHIITENDRVLAAAKALNDADLTLLFQIMHEAHLSLKNDFEITVPATDGLVNICMQALENEGACRQTGGGFGGAVICLCDKKDVAKVLKAVERDYYPRFGLQADILECQASDGLKVSVLEQSTLKKRLTPS